MEVKVSSFSSLDWAEEGQEADRKRKEEEDAGREMQTPEHWELQWGQAEVIYRMRRGEMDCASERAQI